MLKIGRLVIVAIAVTMGSFVGAPVGAAEIQPFSQAAFERAQADGKAIMVTVHADWCPVCKRMKPVEDALLKEPKYKDVVAFAVDFDRQPDALRLLKVGSQATQVFFKGTREVGRQSFVTDRAQMEELLKRASS